MSEERLRAQHYGFLARLLGAAPDGATLGQIATIAGDETAFGQAYGALARKAAQVTAKDVESEFFELFIGVGRGELLPYASFYLTGFLNERPLAELRADLRVMGVERVPGRYEPEDHIAFVCEVMAQLAGGELAGNQARFFDKHIGPWAGQFFDDLAVAPSADFYRAVAEIGRQFVDIESRAFALASASGARE